MFAGLAPLVLEEVVDIGAWIRIRALTRAHALPCPDCGAASGRVHDYHERTVNDVCVDARRVTIAATVRRLVCPTNGCRRTFREKITA
ncbi:hypothetical protein Cme02nite_50920 [Catellatospora methionotrophica]|uniref:Transposase IS204/IS1001/IS1096/IS1165 zinc-finger domain-containing protein n=1 Tax=Catellatospora methionotrophica TaxID=121620 RepID=A0A8J3LE14_9ACTN|nr:hypothetical protein Cme02nite_50920 [Catellatospora methionotrophica]